MNNSYKILINSCEKNLDNGIIEKCLHNLYNRVNSDFILVVVGDSKELKFERREFYNILYVKHNSIDFTALISVVENYQFLQYKLDVPDFWFYIHDTSEFGELFLNKINDFFINNNNIDTNVAIRTPPTYSMNIGLYKYDFLLKNENKLLEKRSSDNPSIEEVHKFKKDGIFWEGCLFNSDIRAFSQSPPLTDGPMIIYNHSNVMRIVEYFECLDIKKYKANWYVRHQGVNYELNA